MMIYILIHHFIYLGLKIHLVWNHKSQAQKKGCYNINFDIKGGSYFLI